MAALLSTNRGILTVAARAFARFRMRQLDMNCNLITATYLEFGKRTVSALTLSDV